MSLFRATPATSDWDGDFVDIDPPKFTTKNNDDPSVFESFTAHSSAPRIYTDAVVTAAVRAKHPDLTLTVNNSMTCNLLGFAQSGHASAEPFGDAEDALFQRGFTPPARRNDKGTFYEQVQFACFKYEYGGVTFLLYVIDTRDGSMPYPSVKMNYILAEKNDKSAKQTDALIEAASRWIIQLHEEVLVFNMGNWVKDAELWKSIMKSSWDDVILEDSKKKALIDDVDSFFDGEKSYGEFSVPWKRGLIFWGPPGNGKTISIKAIMNGLTQRKDPTVELLYVKTLTSFSGPEYSLRLIFQKARAMAPCVLVFEDLDALVTGNVRSYFLNEVDGLESNHGIMMIGSTNHLEQLDPGIAKRPSRFDRKYLFALPTLAERIQYCDYWRNKLKDNKKVDFPAELSAKVAGITEEFSFAYMKEAFVASLLYIVSRQKEEDEEDGAGGGGHGVQHSLLWKVIQEQVKQLRDELDNESSEAARRPGLTMTAGPRDGEAAPTATSLPIREPGLRGIGGRSAAQRGNVATTYGAFGHMSRNMSRGDW